jgi:hypothetical protein
MVDVDGDTLDLLDDEFVFEPNGWDMATDIGIRVDPDADREALDELADAMLVWMPDGPLLERLTTDALDALWSDELEATIREGLADLRERNAWRAGVDAALVELDRDPRAAEVSREVVRHLAMQLSQEDAPLFFCLHCLDEVMASAPGADRRRLASEAAIVARRNAAVPDEGLRRAVAALGRSSVPDLGLSDRREAVRRRLGRIAAFGRVSIPTLARELQAIADEALPPDAADDDVWQVVLTTLLAEVATPERN